MAFLRSVRSLCLALLALGCAPGTPVSVPIYTVGYNPGEELYAGPNVPVLVLGNPFAVPQPETVLQTIDAMQGWSWHNDHFVPAVDPNAVYRVLIVFHPTGNAPGERLCTRPPSVTAQFGAPPAASVPVAMALCRGDSFLSYAFGSLDGSQGPAGPLYRRGIGQFVSLLFPSRNPEALPGRCGGSFDC